MFDAYNDFDVGGGDDDGVDGSIMMVSTRGPSMVTIVTKNLTMVIS
jgi:hypothetical protein